MNRETTTTQTMDIDARIAEMEAQFADATPVDASTEQPPVSLFIKDLSTILRDAPVHAGQFSDSVLLDRLDRDVLRESQGQEQVDEQFADIITRNFPQKQLERPIENEHQKKDGFFKKLGHKVFMMQAGVYAEDRKERLQVNEHDSRLKKFGKNVLRKAYDSTGSLMFGAAALTATGIMVKAAYAAYAVKHGLDFDATMGMLPVEPANDAVNSAPVELPLPPPVVDIPAPAPSHVSTVVDTTPTSTYRHKIIHHMPNHDGGITTKRSTSNGDFTIPVGGATDPDGNIPADTVDPRSTNILRVNYPAQMGPFVGTVPTNVSQAEGVQNVINLVKQHPGATITLKGFSEGSFVTNEAARQLADMGIHVNVINAGDGNGAAGILQRPEVPMIQPILQGAGINYTPPVPGTTELLSGRDAWASTGQDPLGVALDKATKIPVDHRIPGDNEIPVQTFTKDGVNYKVYDQPVDLPVGAVDTTPGAPVVPAPNLPLPPIPAPGPDLPPPPPLSVQDVLAQVAPPPPPAPDAPPAP